MPFARRQHFSELVTQSFLASLELELFGDAASNQQQMQQEIAERLRSEDGLPALQVLVMTHTPKN